MVGQVSTNRPSYKYEKSTAGKFKGLMIFLSFVPILLHFSIFDLGIVLKFRS